MSNRTSEFVDDLNRVSDVISDLIVSGGVAALANQRDSPYAPNSVADYLWRFGNKHRIDRYTGMTCRLVSDDGEGIPSMKIMEHLATIAMAGGDAAKTGKPPQYASDAVQLAAKIWRWGYDNRVCHMRWNGGRCTCMDVIWQGPDSPPVQGYEQSG